MIELPDIPIWAIIILIIMFCGLIYSIIENSKNRNNPQETYRYNYEINNRNSEHDKTMRALRFLIYLIIFLILAAIIIRVFFWAAFIAFIKGTK